jgi:hypothetical protein
MTRSPDAGRLDKIQVTTPPVRGKCLNPSKNNLKNLLLDVLTSSGVQEATFG